MSVNLVILQGHVGADPYVHSDKVAQFNLAVSESWKDEAGHWQERTTWAKVVCFGALAKKAAEKVRRGDFLTVEGKLRTDSYEDKKTGEQKTETKVVATALPDCHIRKHKETKAKTQAHDEFDQAMEQPSFDPNEELPF